MWVLWVVITLAVFGGLCCVVFDDPPHGENYNPDIERQLREQDWRNPHR